MRLRRGNVERIANTPTKVAKLQAEGFEPMENLKKPDEGQEAKAYESMTVAELKDVAKEKGLEGYSSLTKEQLLDVLKDVV